MDYNKYDIQEFELYVRTEFSTGNTGMYQFIYSDGSLNVIPENDFYVPVFLTKNYNHYEYVDIKKDDVVETIERQKINPQFIEIGFFDEVKRIKANIGSDLTIQMIEEIKTKLFPSSTESEIREWYSNTGKNTIEWTTIDDEKLTIYNLETLTPAWDSIVAKANYYPITIWR